MTRGPEPDEIAHGFDIGRLTEELVGFLVLRRAAVTGGDGINEHEIRRVQN